MVGQRWERIARARVARARSAVGRGVRYRLGRGGYDPKDESPGQYSAARGFRECDCTGFAAWVLGLSRRPKRDRPWWIESTAVARDASGPQRVFARLEEPTPGCLAVYGDSWRGEGHAAVVTEVRRDASGRVAEVWGVDCASGPSRRTGEAITERSLGFMRGRAVYCTLREDLE